MQLQTPRLILRDFLTEDAPAVLAYQRDPRYLRFSPRDDRTEDEAVALVQRFIDWRLEEPRLRYQLAITLASSGELIGNVGLRGTDPAAAVAEIGYELAPAHWGRGYATEAARALVDLGFGALGLRRIHSHCIAENDASARVLERLGMRREGRLRQHEFFKERAWDVLLFGILAPEWPAAALAGPAE